jgi:glycosyltransferase involved in cell wall biosynthesis
LFALLINAFGWQEWVYVSIPLSVLVTAFLGMYFMHQATKEISLVEKTEEHFPKPFFFASIVNNLSTAVFLSLDIILVNHFFPPHEAGQYALLSLVGKMVYFLGSLPNAFTITLVSRREGQKRSSRQIFFLIYGVTAAICFGTSLLLGPLGIYTVPFLFGDKTQDILHLLIPYCIALGIFSLNAVFVSYQFAKKRYVFSIATLLISLALVVGIQLFHGSLEDVVRVVLGVSVFGWCFLWLTYFSYRKLPFVQRGMIDFFDIFFGNFPEIKVAPDKKRILVLNWRDTKHRYAGGAEVYVHEMAKTWVREGHHVTLFSGNDGMSLRHEVIDGVRIIRRGGFYLVYMWAFLYYIFRLGRHYDVVVDCENGIPFFTPLYVRRPIVCLMHHVHQDVFFRSLPKPLAWFASFLEKNLMPLVYSNVSFVTVSESSREEMQELGLGNAGITVVHPGVDMEEFSRVLTPKALYPTILYLGRLKAYKSVNILIQAFRIVLSERPEARLVIVGDGEEREHLKQLTRELRFSEEQVKFVGHVGHEEKIKRLQEAWMLVNPSFMEGWGIVAIEANAAGTPVIASNVPGLRDSVRHEGTGYLVEYGDVKGFAERILLIIRDKELREGLATNAQVWAGNFDWKRMSKDFLAVLNTIR